jgi:hypothetical protein
MSVYYGDPKRRGQFLAELSVRASKLWEDPVLRARMSERMLKYWKDNTARRTQMSELLTKRHQDPDFQAKLRAPEALAKRAATIEAKKQQPGYQETCERNANMQRFKRDDSDPKRKEQWDKKLAAAEKAIKGHTIEASQETLSKAFADLYLDPKHYNVKGTPRSTGRGKGKNTLASKMQKAFFNKALTGDPFFTQQEIKDLVKEINLAEVAEGKKKKTDRAKADGAHRDVVETWLRAAALIRKYNIHVDYASIPHLTWMK